MNALGEIPIAPVNDDESPFMPATVWLLIRETCGCTPRPTVSVPNKKVLLIPNPISWATSTSCTPFDFQLLEELVRNTPPLESEQAWKPPAYPKPLQSSAMITVTTLCAAAGRTRIAWGGLPIPMVNVLQGPSFPSLIQWRLVFELEVKTFTFSYQKPLGLISSGAGIPWPRASPSKHNIRRTAAIMRR